MFYTFSQNNSGGHFDYDAKEGISHHVIVEADDEKEAVWLAEKIGLYFDGEGDCSCCGARWSDYLCGSDKTETPMIYETAVEPGSDYEKQDKPSWQTKWMDGAEGFIHYKDGRIEPFWE